MIEGYMIEVGYDGQTLTVHPKNKAARVALRGADHGEGDLVLRRERIAAVSVKEASMLTNGCLRVEAADGATYRLHFRKKQAAAFAELAGALGA